MSALRRRPVALVVSLLLVSCLSACEATRIHRPSDPRFAAELPREGEIFLRDGTAVRAREISVVGDSLLAYRPGTAAIGVEPQIRLARSEVARIEATYLKQPETTILGLAGGAVAVGALVWLVTTDLKYGFGD